MTYHQRRQQVDARLRVHVGLLAGLVIATAFALHANAQNYPLPSKVGTPPTICTGCEGLNSAGQPSAGKPTQQFAAPLVAYVGRLVDSQATPNIQHVGMRTARAGVVRTAYIKRGTAPPRVYAYIGLGTMGAYNLDSFIDRVRSGPLKPVSVINTGARFGARSPLERILSPHAWVYPEAKDSRWLVPFVDRTEKLKDFDFDDRGYVYLAYDIFGWGVVKDTGQVGVSMLPLVDGSQQLGLEVDRIVSLNSKGRYYVATSQSNNVLAGRLLYDVTDPGAPKLVHQTKDAAAGFQSVIRAWAKNDAARVLAAVTADGDLRVWTYDGYVANAAPVKVVTSPSDFTALSFDDQGVLWAIEKPSSSAADAKTRVVRLAPAGKTYVEAASTPFPEWFKPDGIHARGGYLAAFGTVKRGKFVRNNVFIFKIGKDGSLTNLDPGDFFLRYYHAAPAGFAQPKGYNSSPQDVHLLTPGDGKVYLLYMNYGLGDVYQLGDAAPVTVVDGPPKDPVDPCKCACAGQ